ncbi:MAG: hypothetical protein RI903_1035, partial [Bacteroidota bacterium]
MIKQFLSKSKSKLNQLVSALGNSIVALFAKLLGERRYTWVLGYVTLGKIFAEIQWRRLEAYY